MNKAQSKQGHKKTWVKPLKQSNVLKTIRKRQKLGFIGDELFLEVCSYVACGMSLAKIAKLPGMPNVYTILKKANENDINTGIYLRARGQGTLAFAEDLLEIADNKSGDVDRDKLRIDARKFLMSKMNRALFGDNIQVEGNPSKPIVIKWADSPSTDNGPMVQGDSAKVINGTVNENVADHADHDIMADGRADGRAGHKRKQ